MGEPSLKNGGKNSGSEDLYFQLLVFYALRETESISF